MTDPISIDELRLAARNSAMPLEALRWAITPVGLHYLLSHFDIPAVDPGAFRLEVGGCVRSPLSLSLEELAARERVTLPVTMECAGNGRAGIEPRPISQPWLTEAVGTAEWTGTPLAGLLAEADPDADALEVVFSGLDHGFEGGVAQAYERSLPLEEARGSGALLAWELGGAPLPPQHGFPLRLVVPGWYGMTNVKWLARITVSDTPFEGYQQARSYRLRRRAGEPGEPITRMRPRALMVPPGVPDFMTRRRFVPCGPCRLEGRAWTGRGAISRVEVSVDGGERWRDAELGEQLGPHAWRAWSWRWDPSAPGEHELCCRASDSAGNVQPLEPGWNLGGYLNNAVQRIPVTVTTG